MAKRQSNLDPKQAEFLSCYMNPKSETFGNALQSALRAGYSEEYASNITNLMPTWLSENIGKYNRLMKAEKVLDEMLDMDILTKDETVDSALAKIKQDTAKFIAETIGKDRGYTKRQEMTGADGKDLTVQIIEDTELKDANSQTSD
jgi:phage terminase small subunit